VYHHLICHGIHSVSCVFALLDRGDALDLDICAEGELRDADAGARGELPRLPELYAVGQAIIRYGLAQIAHLRVGLVHGSKIALEVREKDVNFEDVCETRAGRLENDLEVLERCALQADIALDKEIGHAWIRTVWACTPPSTIFASRVIPRLPEA
jgi:hypothetical protein